MSKFLSIYELSERLGLSPSWIRRQAKAGELPFVRDRNRMRFPADEAVTAASELAVAHGRVNRRGRRDPTGTASADLTAGMMTAIGVTEGGDE